MEIEATPEEVAVAARHGRFARRPTEIPWAGWKDVLWRTVREISDDDILQIAAGVAFWGLLSLFPVLIAIISMYGLLADSNDVIRQVNALSHGLPWAARTLIASQLTWIANRPNANLTVGLVGSLTFAIFSASSGVAALMRGINVAYDERDTRGWVRQRLLALLFTAAVSLFVMLAVSAITLLPTALAHVGLGDHSRRVIGLLRWPTLGATVMLGLVLLYRYAPQRTPPRWPWVMWGAALGTLLWIAVSVAFSAYAENFGRFNKTYGALGGVVALLLWMYLSNVAILLGAELNAELEHQIEEDSTIGPARPMGERHALVADTLGDIRPQTESKRILHTVGNTLSDLNRPGRGKKRRDRE